jgi:hypothetical protein
LVVGLVSLTSSAAHFYTSKPLAFVPFGSALGLLLSGAACGVGIAVFIWWLFLEIKRLMTDS